MPNIISSIFFQSYGDHRDLHSFPTRRSSDLLAWSGSFPAGNTHGRGRRATSLVDRKSTRLNSSHTVISYAVFCLKKKKKHLMLGDIGQQRYHIALSHAPLAGNAHHGRDDSWN